MLRSQQNAISGLAWSFVDSFFKIGIEFVIGILLARLLSPKEFGLIGTTVVFITLSQAFMDGGFSQSLIRKKDCTQHDYSTVFYFNLGVGAIFYFLLFLLARPISLFLKEPGLIDVIRAVSVVLVINSFSIIQKVILAKRIDFKLQTKISIISSVVSGSIAIVMAYAGYGIWSLVWKTVIMYFLTTLLLWMRNYWFPERVFSFCALKEHFKFGYKLLIASTIDSLYQNIYYLIIGKFFSVAEVGYYSRAEQFSSLLSVNMTNIIHRVSYPAFSQMQDDLQRLKRNYKKLIRCTMFISFTAMIGMAAIAKPLVIVLIGEKWAPSVIYLQLLCFSAMFYPLHALNLDILNIRGRPDLFLRLEVVKKILLIPIILITVFGGVKAMLTGLIIVSFGIYFLNSYWSGEMIKYPAKEQMADIFPSFLLAVCMGILVFLSGHFLNLKPLPMLIAQILIGTAIVLRISESFKLEAYSDIKEVIVQKTIFLK